MAAEFFLLERAYQFSKNVVLFIKKQRFDRIYFGVVDQLFRSATSITANIIEARSGPSRKNLTHFLTIALRSANETKYWLRLLRDTMDLVIEDVDKLRLEADEISKILAKAIVTLKTGQAQ